MRKSCETNATTQSPRMITHERRIIENISVGLGCHGYYRWSAWSVTDKLFRDGERGTQGGRGAGFTHTITSQSHEATTHWQHNNPSNDRQAVPCSNIMNCICNNAM